jgi:predicted ATPase
MAHITEIKIDGLLGRESPLHFVLERDVNVFFGDNGCGKTTLLKILDAAMNFDADAIARLPVSRAEVHVFSLTEGQVIKHVWDRKREKDEGRDRQFELIDPAELSQSDRLRYIKMRESANEWKRSPTQKKGRSKVGRWAHSFLPTTRLYLGESPIPQGSGKSRVFEDQLDAVFADSVNRAWILFNSKTLTDVRNIQEEGLRAVLYSVLSTNRDAPTDSLLDPTDAYVRVRKFLQRQTESGPTMLGSVENFRGRYKNEKDLRRVVANLDDVEQKVEAAMAPLDRFVSTLQTLYSNGKKIAPRNNALAIELNSGEMLSPAALSSGEKHLLKLLLTAMTAQENSVMIDEPELSMHIDWQRHFVETVHALNPACQLILATHSPEIMAELPDSKIFRI